MARTGKTEQIANYYLIAANGFIKEYFNEENWNKLRSINRMTTTMTMKQMKEHTVQNGVITSNTYSN